MTMTSVQLGVLDMSGNEIQECGKCHSRNIVTVKGELDKEKVSQFVRSRAARLGLQLDDYKIRIDRETGVVVADLKPPKAEVEFEID